jgi:hypothetical protein
MPAGLWFWLIWVILFLFGGFLSWPTNPADRNAWRPFGVTFIILILIGLLGWGIYGPPIK